MVALSVYEKERMDRLDQGVAAHEARLDQLTLLLEKKVSQDAFLPVKMIAYGLMSTAGFTVLLAVLRAVLK